MAFRIVVLGGYGNFGGRICRSFATNKEIWLGVAGRDLMRAEEFVRALGAPAALCEPLSIDHQGEDFSSSLGALRPGLVIHTSGPFQHQAYHVAAAAIEAGAHYVDLADGRAFVAGIGTLDGAARSRGVLVASGASTLPAVSSAVIDRLASGFEQVEIGIAPGQAVPRGMATLEAVLSCCGQPMPAVLVQPITGGVLMLLLGYRYDTAWFAAVVALFMLTGACWIPVVVIQYRQRDLAIAASSFDSLPREFHQLMRRWIMLGVPAFSAVLLIVILMVTHAGAGIPLRSS